MSTDLLTLGDEPFVSLTTFRRSGEGVSVPVWIAREDDALVVTTPAGSGKVKRLRNDPRVELRPSSRMGRVADDAVAVRGVATIVADDRAHDEATARIRDKYGLEYKAIMAAERLTRSGGERVILRITRP